MEQRGNFLATDTDVTRPAHWRVVLMYTALVVSIASICSTIIFFLFLYTPTNTALLNAVMVLLRIPTPEEQVVEVEIYVPPVPVQIAEVVIPPTTAFSYLVEDTVSGEVLLSQKPDAVWPLASITKLMTALVVLDMRPDWTTTTVVIGADSLDSFMYAGDTYTYQELWDAMLIGSSNKAALTLATALSGSEDAFVVRMNEKARSLGLSSSTVFVDASGLSDGNVGTAQDVSVLVQTAMVQENIAQTVLREDTVLFSKERNKRREILNTNWLLTGWIPNTLEIVGGKTGHTLAAAYNFAMITRDETNTRPISVVVLGAQTHEARFTEALALAQAVWSSYQWP